MPEGDEALPSGAGARHARTIGHRWPRDHATRHTRLSPRGKFFDQWPSCYNSPNSGERRPCGALSTRYRGDHLAYNRQNPWQRPLRDLCAAECVELIASCGGWRGDAAVRRVYFLRGVDGHPFGGHGYLSITPLSIDKNMEWALCFGNDRWPIGSMS